MTDPIAEASTFISHRWQKPSKSKAKHANITYQSANHVLHDRKVSPELIGNSLAYQPLYCDEYIEAHSLVSSYDSAMSLTPREKMVSSLPRESSRQRPQSATTKRIHDKKPKSNEKNFAGHIDYSPQFKDRVLQKLEIDTLRLLDGITPGRQRDAWGDNCSRGAALTVVRMKNSEVCFLIISSRTTQRGKETSRKSSPDSLSHRVRYTKREATITIYKFVCRNYLRRKRNQILRHLKQTNPQLVESHVIQTSCHSRITTLIDKSLQPVNAPKRKKTRRKQQAKSDHARSRPPVKRNEKNLNDKEPKSKGKKPHIHNQAIMQPIHSHNDPLAKIKRQVEHSKHHQSLRKSDDISEPPKEDVYVQGQFTMSAVDAYLKRPQEMKRPRMILPKVCPLQLDKEQNLEAIQIISHLEGVCHSLDASTVTLSQNVLNLDPISYLDKIRVMDEQRLAENGSQLDVRAILPDVAEDTQIKIVSGQGYSESPKDNCNVGYGVVGALVSSPVSQNSETGVIADNVEKPPSTQKPLESPNEDEMLVCIYHQFSAAKVIQTWYRRRHKLKQLQSPGLISGSRSPVIQSFDAEIPILPHLVPLPPFNTIESSATCTTTPFSTLMGGTPLADEETPNSIVISCELLESSKDLDQLYSITVIQRCVLKWLDSRKSKFQLTKNSGHVICINMCEANTAAFLIQRQYRVFVYRTELRVALRAMVSKYRRQARQEIKRQPIRKSMTWRTAVWVSIAFLRLKHARYSEKKERAARKVQRQYAQYLNRKSIQVGLRVLLYQKRKRSLIGLSTLATDGCDDVSQTNFEEAGIQIDSEWIMYTDATTGDPYYYNTKTGESRWQLDLDAQSVYQPQSIPEYENEDDEDEYIIGGLDVTMLPEPSPLSPLIDAWSQITDNCGYIYYLNTTTSETTWVPPKAWQQPNVGNMDPWDTYCNELGILFYYNSFSGETRWELPSTNNVVNIY